jgi:hypothetical protein
MAVAAQQSAGMAGVLGGATKGIAGWAVSSLQSRVSLKETRVFYQCLILVIVCFTKR